MTHINGNSGSTTPYTMSVAGDRDTATSYSGEDIESVGSGPRPPPPYNTPAHTIAGSTVPDDHYIVQRASEIDLSRLNISTSPISDVGRNDTSVDTASSADTEATEHHHEHSTWEAEAMDLIEHALARLAVLAKDKHMEDPSKSVEQHYSELLAKAIKDGEIRFDASFLQ